MQPKKGEADAVLQKTVAEAVSENGNAAKHSKLQSEMPKKEETLVDVLTPPVPFEMFSLLWRTAALWLVQDQ